MRKKVIFINGIRTEVILPRGMKAEDIPTNIRTKYKIENVGIRKDQKERIIKVLEKGRSINSFVQEAVEIKLNDGKRDSNAP